MKHRESPARRAIIAGAIFAEGAADREADVLARQTPSIKPFRWGWQDLSDIRACAKRGHDLDRLAKGRCTKAEMDLVLWNLLGRSVPDACYTLNGGDR